MKTLYTCSWDFIRLDNGMIELVLWDHYLNRIIFGGLLQDIYVKENNDKFTDVDIDGLNIRLNGDKPITKSTKDLVRTILAKIERKSK